MGVLGLDERRDSKRELGRRSHSCQSSASEFVLVAQPKGVCLPTAPVELHWTTGALPLRLRSMPLRLPGYARRKPRGVHPHICPWRQHLIVSFEIQDQFKTFRPVRQSRRSDGTVGTTCMGLLMAEYCQCSITTEQSLPLATGSSMSPVSGRLGCLRCFS